MRARQFIGRLGKCSDPPDAGFGGRFLAVRSGFPRFRYRAVCSGVLGDSYPGRGIFVITGRDQQAIAYRRRYRLHLVDCCNRARRCAVALSNGRQSLAALDRVHAP